MRIPSLAAGDEAPTWPPLLASRGPGARSAPHAHHALHLVLAASGSLSFRVGEAEFRAAGVLTAPDVLHGIDGTGVEVLLVFLDPESDAGVALAGTLDGPARSVSDQERRALLDGPQPDGAAAGGGMVWASHAVATLGAGTLAPRQVHPRVRRALAHLRSAPDDTSLQALAAAAGLSEGRFMHAFTASVGIPLRPYLAWQKLQRSAAAIAAGASLTEAAHAGGFTDSAHMTRSFVRMFGMRPGEVRDAIRGSLGAA